MAITDLSNVDTTPGCGHLFSPPADFAGGEEEFADWLKRQFDADGHVAQSMILLSRHLCGRANFPMRVNIAGPFASRFTAACRKLDAWGRSP